MKRKNTERAAKRRAEAFGEQAELCRMMPCCVCHAQVFGRDISPAVSARAAIDLPALSRCANWGSDPHHVPTRGAGGVDKDTVPLCREHHREWHDIGEKSFDAKYGVPLRGVAKAIHDELTQNVAQGMEQSE
jgi:hypothetical protein